MNLKFKKIIKVLFIISLILISYSAYVLVSVKSSASKIVSGQPYCIQVSQSSLEFRGVNSIFELSGLHMKGSSLINHALLVVGDPYNPSLYHWSYWSNKFNKSTGKVPPIYCKPEVNFIENLRFYRGSPEENVEFIFQGYQFSIPTEYNLKVSYNTRNLIRIVAKSPWFKPPSQPKNYQNALFSDIMHDLVYIQIGYNPIIKSWRQTEDLDHKVKSIGVYKNLIKEKIYYKKNSNLKSIQYYERDVNGKIKTLIICYGNAPNKCKYFFTDNEFSYQFHHTLDGIKEWQEMQQKLINLKLSFIINYQTTFKK